MYSTKEVLRALKDANPEATVTEDQIRNAIRRGNILPPAQFAGRFAWTNAQVQNLAKTLGLKVPVQPRNSNQTPSKSVETFLSTKEYFNDQCT